MFMKAGHHVVLALAQRMPGLFVLKSFILVFCVLVGLQGLAMAARSILVLADREELLPDDLRYGAREAKEAH